MARGTGHLIPFLGTLPLRWDLTRSPRQLGFGGALKKNLVKKIYSDPAENLHAARANSAIGECGQILGKIENLTPHLWLFNFRL